MVFGVNVFDLDFGVQINSIEQPIKRSSVGPGNMSHCRTSAFDDHLDHSFVVFKDVQHDSIARRIRVRRNKIDIGQFKIFLISWCLTLRICAFLRCFTMQRVSPCWSLLCLRFDLGCGTSKIKSQRSSAGIPSRRKSASQEIITVSVEQCETDVCFLRIQLIGTNVCLRVFKISRKFRVLK